ncbi:MAG: hypothetical protein QXE05_11820 [Nitrososphaeria archaeon]
MGHHQYYKQKNKKNLDNTKLLLGIACLVIIVLIIFIIFNQSQIQSKTSIPITKNLTPVFVTSTVNKTITVKAVYNPTSYNGQAPVIFTQTTALTGNIITTNNITILLRGVVINTKGYSLISGKTFNNQGIIVPGLANNSGDNASYSYGGSGGGGWAFGCGNAAGGSTVNNGGSTVVSGGLGLNNGFNLAATSGTSASSLLPTLNNFDIQTMYNRSIQQYLEGAGGGSATNCGSTEIGGSGSYGVYIQANKVIAGFIDTRGQAGSGSNEEASGGGGGGAIIISYGLGGYIPGLYNYTGGAAGIANYGKAGAGGSGVVVIYNYSSSMPPITP